VIEIIDEGHGVPAGSDQGRAPATAPVPPVSQGGNQQGMGDLKGQLRSILGMALSAPEETIVEESVSKKRKRTTKDEGTKKVKLTYSPPTTRIEDIVGLDKKGGKCTYMKTWNINLKPNRKVNSRVNLRHTNTNTNQAEPNVTDTKGNAGVVVDGGLLLELVRDLQAHPASGPFCRPVTRREAPDYRQVVARPIHLGTIRSSLDSLRYSSNQQVFEDIELVFHNCREYNPPGSEVLELAAQLEEAYWQSRRRIGL
jgi:hypothetical protein